MQLREAAAPVPAQETAGRDSDKPFEGKTVGFRLQGLQGTWGVSQNAAFTRDPKPLFHFQKLTCLSRLCFQGESQHIRRVEEMQSKLTNHQ